MSTVSPELVLGLCILGACVTIVIGYALSRLLHNKVLNEHEESEKMTNPFHDMSQEQKDYMADVRRRNNDDAWERLRVELRKDKERQNAVMGIRGGGGGSGVVSEPRFLVVFLYEYGCKQQAN
jgi:thermostable 8-oxoguanine DNA glycosylase